MARQPRARYWLALSGLVLLLDQLSKALVVSQFEVGHILPLTSYFNLVRVHNAGAAFSFLAQAGGWQRWFFSAIGVVAIVYFISLLVRNAHQKLFSLALALLLGGAIGNVIDRLVHGHVIDFLDFHFSWLEFIFAGGHFPAFNLADSAICLGAFLLLTDELLRVLRRRG